MTQKALIAPEEVMHWLSVKEASALQPLWARADEVRRAQVGDAVHLRGLVEISSHCVRSCAYCGLRAANTGLQRYRMTAEEILECARLAVSFGYGTVVLQAGEDYGLKGPWVAHLVRRIKEETPLAVTLSLGERPDAELAAWREAGADRYLMRFETSDPALYRKIHPDYGGRISDRIAILRRLRAMGYEVGSGIMVGIPGQTLESIQQDLLLFRQLDLDMIGIGPYIPHPETPLGGMDAEPCLPDSEQLTYIAIALTRLLCPQSNIPATTALATLNQAEGRETALQRGANVIMPNLTPVHYRPYYEIYPAKVCIHDTADTCRRCLHGRVRAIGRHIGTGTGARKR